MASLALLSGCAQAALPYPTLQVAMNFGITDAQVLNKLVEGINRRHRGEFALKAMNVPGAEYMTKVDTMLAGKVAPDIFFVVPGTLPSYAEIGAVEDLTDRFKADASIDLSDYYPGALQASSWKGRYYGLPWVMRPLVLYYNRELFDQASLAYPSPAWDWQTFFNTAKKLTRKDGEGNTEIYGFANPSWQVSLWVWQNGGHLIDEAKGRPTLDAPETVEAFKFLEQIRESGVSPSFSTLNQMGVGALFNTGKIAMYYGTADEKLEADSRLRVGACELPHGKNRATQSWIPTLVISAQSAHKAEAYVAYKELLDGLHRSQVMPPRRSLARQLEAFAPQKAYAKPAILAAMETARNAETVLQCGLYESFFWERIANPLSRGDFPATEIAESGQQILTRTLELSQ